MVQFGDKEGGLLSFQVLNPMHTSAEVCFPLKKKKKGISSLNVLIAFSLPNTADIPADLLVEWQSDFLKRIKKTNLKWSSLKIRE